MSPGLWNPRSLKDKSDLHLARKIWHVSGVLAMILLYWNLSRSQSLQLAAVVVFVFVGLDVWRQNSSRLNMSLLRLFRPIMREHETHSLAGTSYLLVGVFLIIILFSRDIVTLSLLFLAFADPIASYVGIRHGRDKIIGEKSLQGTMAAFFVCAFISCLYFFFQSLMTERLLIVSLIAGLIGAFSELIPIGKLDDNFSFPVLSSGLLWILFYIFGGT